MCHSLSLVYRRVPPRQPPRLLQHLCRRIRQLHRRTRYFDVSRYTENPATERLEVRVRSYGETRCIDQQKPRTQIRIKDAKTYRAIFCMTFRTGCRNPEKIWSVKIVLESHGETRRLRIETLPVPLMNHFWSREQKRIRVRASMVSTLTFRKTRTAISA